VNTVKLDEFFVTGDPIIYGADASIVLVTLAIIFVLTLSIKNGNGFGTNG